MRKRQGRYYLGRVSKVGITSAEVIDIIQKPKIIQIGQHAWTITDHKISNDQKNIFGKLVKFRPQGRLDVIDIKNSARATKIAENMIIATSPFIYISDYSGIAYLHVWNQIETQTFARRFAEIVRETKGNFFMDCEIETISDFRTFAAKVSSLTRVDRIQATVRPPNPLFGHLWEGLKTYLQQRNSAEMKISEEGIETDKGAQGLSTQLPSTISDIERSKDLQKLAPIPIGDQAILMAADGYGKGLIEGPDAANVKHIIKTTEAHLSFLADKDPLPETLEQIAIPLLETIKKQRYMEH
jgi:hypothetical protein